MEAEGEASASQVSESAAQQQMHLGQIINQGIAAFLQQCLREYLQFKSIITPNKHWVRKKTTTKYF